MKNATETAAANQNEDYMKELASLARLVAFAKENAKELNAEFPAYCLDLALGALLQDLKEGCARPAEDPAEASASSQTMH